MQCVKPVNEGSPECVRQAQFSAYAIAHNKIYLLVAI